MKKNPRNVQEQGLSAWQLTLLALGTVIGGSFFIGSSVAIHAAGPAILLSYIFGGALVYLILYSLSEMTVANPTTGSFRTYAAESFGPGVGFVIGWVYWTGMVLAMSSEATAISILLRQWVPGMSISVSGTIIIVGVTLLNLLGADKLSKLEGGLASIKLLLVASFILIGILLIVGGIPGISSVGIGALGVEPFAPRGISGIAGSMLIVLFSYAGFEIIGLAASEAKNPGDTIPRAITYTVLSLVGLYVVSVAVLLPLIPTDEISADQSSMVAALTKWGMGWAGKVLNAVLVTAILSTMLAAMFGLGRMMRSLADEGLAPSFLKDRKEVPFRGILFSGLAMLVSLGVGLLLPSVYVFLISSGGFALLITYFVIIATHIRFRKKYGCPPDGKCQMPGFPYTSWIALVSLAFIVISMPLVPGQATGLIAGIFLIGLYVFAFLLLKKLKIRDSSFYKRNRP